MIFPPSLAALASKTSDAIRLLCKQEWQQIYLEDRTDEYVDLATSQVGDFDSHLMTNSTSAYEQSVWMTIPHRRCCLCVFALQAHRPKPSAPLPRYSGRGDCYLDQARGGY